MKDKLTSILHGIAVVLIFHFSDSFGLQIALRVAESELLIDLISNVLTLGSMIGSLWIYCHYLLKRPLREMGLGKPYFKGKWAAAGILLPVILILGYLLVTDGTWQFHHPSPANITGSVMTTVFYWGIFSALTESILLHGFLLTVLRPVWGNVISVILVNVTLALFINSYMGTVPAILMGAAASILFNTAMCLVTMESGSVWAACFINAAVSILLKNNYILYLNTDFDYTAMGRYTVWSYLFPRGSLLFSGPYDGINSHLGAGLPAMIGFVVLIAAAVISMRRNTKNRGGDGHTDHTDD